MSASHSTHPLERGIDFIDRWQRRLGHGVGWLALVLALAQFSVVVMRHGLDLGFVWQQVNIRHLNGAFCLMGIGYALLHDAHVRVDIFYRPASARTKAWIDLAGTVVFILPLCGVLVWTSRDYVLNAWLVLEGSNEGGGVPLIFLYKSLLWAAAGVLFAQGISLAGKAGGYLYGTFEDYALASPRDTGGAQALRTNHERF
jgi:TRAP-type mannitol/chloroaromatic compound transport system permease small subunit